MITASFEVGCIIVVCNMGEGGDIRKASTLKTVHQKKRCPATKCFPTQIST